MNMVKDEDLMHTLFFSGGDFIYSLKESAHTILEIFRLILKSLSNTLENNGGGSSLDDRVGQATRLRRIPNTVNMASDDGQGNPLYCIPLFYEDVISMNLSEVICLWREVQDLFLPKVGV